MIIFLNNRKIFAIRMIIFSNNRKISDDKNMKTVTITKIEWETCIILVITNLVKKTERLKSWTIYDVDSIFCWYFLWSISKNFIIKFQFFFCD
jgi:hypothetical protein